MLTASDVHANSVFTGKECSKMKIDSQARGEPMLQNINFRMA